MATCYTYAGHLYHVFHDNPKSEFKIVSIPITLNYIGHYRQYYIECDN